MEVKVLKVGRGELSLEIRGETYTLLNLLQRVLLEDKNVEFAGFKIPHRLLDVANFHLRMKEGARKTAFESLFEALDRIRRESVEFREVFEKALKEYRG